MAEKEVKPDLASLVANIAREETLQETAHRLGRGTGSSLQQIIKVSHDKAIS
jgi:hypothetical protein